MNSTTKNIFKTIGKGVAVIVTPGSFIVIILFLICFLYYRYKKNKDKKELAAATKPDGVASENKSGPGKTA